MNQGIYKIINVVNNKFYVGSAVNLRKRKSRHFSELRTGKHKNRHLLAAWNKYGEQAFVFVVVEEVEERERLLEAENRWLKEHVGKEYCYNIGTDATAPALGMTGELSPTWGYRHTDSARAQIGVHSKGRAHTPESREKIRQFLIGKPKSAEVRAKISATLSGAGNPNYGKPRPDEFKAKVSKAVEAISPDGEVAAFPSIVALRKTFGLAPPTVNRAVKSGRPLKKGPYKGWVFRYMESSSGAA
jgi:group I intron endonuclease